MGIFDNLNRYLAIVTIFLITVLSVSGCASSNNTSDNTETINANAQTSSSDEEVVFTVDENGSTIVQTQPLVDENTVEETENDDEPLIEEPLESDETTPVLDSPKNVSNIPDNITSNQLQSAFEMDAETAQTIASLPENERRQAVYDYAEKSPLLDVDYEDEVPTVLSPYAAKSLTIIGDGEGLETKTLTFATLEETKTAYDDLCAKYGEERILIEKEMESFADNENIPDLSDEEWEALFANVEVEEVSFDGRTFTEEITSEITNEDILNTDISAETANMPENEISISEDIVTENADKIDSFEAEEINIDELVPGTEGEIKEYAATVVGQKNASTLGDMNLPAAADLLEACTADKPVTIAIVEMYGVNSDHNSSSHVKIDPNSACVGFNNLSVPRSKAGDYAYYYEQLSYKSTVKAGTSNYKYWKDEENTSSHGTAVLSVVAAGVPKGAKILLIKPAPKGGTLNALTCLKYARDKGAKVVNASWGSSISTADKQTVGMFEACMKDYEKNKIMLVAAAGNDNINIRTSKKVLCPACLSQAVTVSAVDSSKKKASFSNYGKEVDFAAPGCKILVADKKNKRSYAYKNGTSFAAPAVTAFAANIYSLYPNKTRAQIQDIMKGMSKDLGAKGWDQIYGYGFPIFNLSKIPFSITYANLNGLKAPSKTSYNVTSAVTLSAPSGTRKGYTFTGWYTSTNSSGKKVTTIAKGSKGNVKVYARFKANNYNISFNANGGKGTMTEQKMTYDKAATLNANKFTRDGYTFAGWNTKANGKGTTYKNKASVKNLAASGKVTLYAQWAGKSYSITFNANGGKGSMTKQTMTYGKAAALSANKFARTGYAFAGWNTKADGTGTTYKDKASVKNLAPSGTITLYAKWAGQSYSIVFNANGGKGSMAEQKMTYGKAAALTPNKFTKDGYTFAGWNTKANGKGTTYKDSASVGNLVTSGKITLYAMWTVGSTASPSNIPTPSSNTTTNTATNTTKPSTTTKISLRTGWTAYDANNNVITPSYVASGFNMKPIKYIKKDQQRLDVGNQIEVVYLQGTSSKIEFALIKGSNSASNVKDAFLVLYKVK